MASRIVEVLPARQLRHVFGTPAEGRMAATFVCSVQWSCGQIERTYVKCFRKSQPLGLVNEITGFLLARSVGVPVPEKAGLLQLQSVAFPSLDLSDFQPYSFAISESDGQTLVSSFRVQDLVLHSALKDIVRNWSMLSDALAFDDWVANSDRNQGNILIAGPEDITLIDHSNLPVTLNWDAAMLDPCLNSTNTLAAIVHGMTNPTPPHIASEMEIATRKHDAAYKAVCEELNFWWNTLMGSDSIRLNALKSFIELRAVSGNDRVAAQCGAKVK